MHTGASFTTPTISSTTSYFVEDVVAKSNVGNTNSNSNGANHTTAGRYLIFDCTESVILEQVTINAAGTGEIEIDLQNSLGEVINSVIVFVNAGVQAIDLDFEIPVANNLRLVGKNFSTGGLYRNNSSVSFPYANGSISIKDSSAGTGFYYFFYDWKIGSIKSAREEVVVTVNSSPVADFTHVVNPTDNGEVTFTNTSADATTYSWDFGDGSGTSTDPNPVYTYTTSGTYDVELTSTNAECGNDITVIQVTVTVNTLGIEDNSLSGINIYPNPFNNQLDISIPNSLGNDLDITLYDIRGREIQNKVISQNTNNIVLQGLDELTRGAYLLLISDRSNGNKLTKKVIKQ